MTRGLLLRAGIIASVITLAQVLMCLLLAPGPSTPPERYLQVPFPPAWDQNVGKENPILYRYIRLNNWDSFHYFSAAHEGYHAPPGDWHSDDVSGYRVEFSFLPAFPIVARILSKLTSIPLEIVLPLTSQIFAIIFWTFFYLDLILVCQVSESMAILVMGVFALTPGAFYLVAAYSEAIFLCSLAGMVLFSELWFRDRRKICGLLSVLFGLLGTWSRIVGFVLALFPLFMALRTKIQGRWRWGALLFSAIMVSGTGGYFIFCRIYSGHWDAYFRLYKLGWEMRTEYLGCLNPFIYIPRFFFEEGEISLHRGLLLSCLLGIFGAFWKDADRREHLPYTILGLGLFYMTVAGKAGMGFQGMLRYILPILWVVLVLLAAVFRDRVHLVLRWKWVWVLFALLLLKLQSFYAYRYLHGLWVS